MRMIWILALITLLTACSTVAPPAATTPVAWEKRKPALTKVHSWTLNGKIAVISARDSGSATVDWRQSQGAYDIAITGPLGSGGFKMTGRSGAVTLKMADGKSYSAGSAEQLLAEHWGYHLPVSNLNYWIRGLPVPGIPAKTNYDSAGRLSSLNQQGWNIQFPSYTHSGSVDLPSRIFASSADLKVKFVVYSWNVQ